MLARLQQAITLAQVFGALAWLAWFLPTSPGTAWAGFGLLLGGHSIILGLEFVVLYFVSHTDPAPRPTWQQLLGAWWGETLAALQVFCWRQPFFSGAVPDQLDPSQIERGQRGVVLIHGFVCNRGFWNPWLNILRERRHAFVAVNLEPMFGSIDDYVAIIDHAVQQVAGVTGQPPVLVCHSMGGLAARAWLRTKPAGVWAHQVITIGTPHHGTWFGQFSHAVNGRQMRIGGDWLAMLSQSDARISVERFTCWYSNCDNIVLPASTATLPYANNRLVKGVAHVQLAFHAEVMRASLVEIGAL